MDKKWKWGRSKIRFYYVPISIFGYFTIFQVNAVAESGENRLPAGLYQLDDVCVEPDRRHRHDNQEFTQLLERIRHADRKLEYCGHDGCQHEKEYKERKSFFQAEGRACRIFRLLPAPDGKDQCDRNDRKGSCHFYDCSGFQRIASVDPVPCSRGGRNRRSIVAGEQAEALIAQAKHGSQCGEDEGSEHIEQEDDRDGLCHFLVGGLYYRSCSCDGAPAADRRTDSYQYRVVCTQFQRFV